MYKAHVRDGHPIQGNIHFSMHFVKLDAMQVFDHHGIAAVVDVSIVRELIVEAPLLGRTQKARLDAINVEANEYYDSHVVNNRMPKLRLANSLREGWSELCGPLVLPPVRFCIILSFHFVLLLFR